MINRYASLKQGLVGCWCPSVSGSFGFRLPDLSQYGNHGTLTNMDPGTDWVPSGGKLALDFDGSNDFVVLPSSPSFDLSGNKTIAAWVFIRSLTKIFSLFARNQPATPNVGYSCGVNASGNLYYTKQNVVGLSDTSRLVGLNAWNHIAFAKDASGVDFYLNGISTRVANSQTETGGSSPSVYIGSTARDSGVTEADGFIDDVRLYNRVLTTSEIRLLYTGGRGVGFIPERIKHRRKTTAAASNRRRRLICGANC